MTTPTERLLSLFVAPAAGSGPAAADTGRSFAAAADDAACPAVGVLCAARDAEVIGAATGVALTVRARARTALVVVWHAEADQVPLAEQRPAVGMALPAARALAARLARRGVAAKAIGRVALATVPADPALAVVATGRALAAADGLPTAVVLAGPRPAAFDDLLAAQDRIIVAASPGLADGVAELAAIDGSRAGRATGVVSVPSSPPVRSLAAAGLVLPPALRAGIAAAFEGRGG